MVHDKFTSWVARGKKEIKDIGRNCIDYKRDLMKLQANKERQKESEFELITSELLTSEDARENQI